MCACIFVDPYRIRVSWHFVRALLPLFFFEHARRIVLHSEFEKLINMSVSAAPPASEELTPTRPPRRKKENSPIPPPRRKRANSHSPKHYLESSDSSSSSNSKDTCAAAKRGERFPLSHANSCPPSESARTKKETSVAVKLLPEEWMRGGSMSLPRVENYYMRGDPEMRRKISASQATIVSPLTSPQAQDQNASSHSLSTNAERETSAAVAGKEESPTRSKRPSAAGPTQKGGSLSTHRRPPKPPAPYHSTRNKTATYSQLYGVTTDTAASRSTTTIVVIDSKAADASAGGERSLNLAPRTYGKMSGGSHTKSGRGSNRDDTSIVYGKKTQAALNTLVAAMKRFQGSSGQKTSRKSNANKTPPKRPPPAAMGNATHPSVPKSSNDSTGDESPLCATYPGINRSEDNPCVNSYDDHIYMEVGQKFFKSQNVTGSSGGSTAGLEGEDEEEGDYVIMNPGDNSHVYTPLAFHTRSNSTG